MGEGLGDAFAAPGGKDIQDRDQRPESPRKETLGRSAVVVGQETVFVDGGSQRRRELVCRADVYLVAIPPASAVDRTDRKSTRLNSSHW